MAKEQKAAAEAEAEAEAEAAADDVFFLRGYKDSLSGARIDEIIKLKKQDGRYYVEDDQGFTPVELEDYLLDREDVVVSVLKVLVKPISDKVIGIVIQSETNYNYLLELVSNRTCDEKVRIYEGSEKAFIHNMSSHMHLIEVDGSMYTFETYSLKRKQ